MQTLYLFDSMGLCHTEEQANSIQRNTEIDRQLERDRGRREKEYKILLLGEIPIPLSMAPFSSFCLVTHCMYQS